LIQGVSFYCPNTLNERNFIMLFEAWRALIPLLTTTKARVIRKDWKGSPFPRKGNAGNSHNNVELATRHVLPKKNTT